MAFVDENAAMGPPAEGKTRIQTATAHTARAPLGNIANRLPSQMQGVSLGVGPQKPVGVTTRQQKAAAQQAAGRVPLAPVPQQAANVQAQPPARSARTRKSLSAQLVESSAAAQPRKKPTQAANPASPMPDIDSQDRADPLQASDLACTIFAYHKRTEGLYRPLPTYMNRQQDINDKMRAILVDWLVEVHLKFKLMPETLFLTANLIDRFLEIKGVTRKNLQLVGVTAMLIASKYEEIWAPELHDFVYISDRAYRKDQILAMEKVMLNSLKFNLTVPTPYNFLSRFLKAAGASRDKQVQLLASYLTELALPDYSMLRHSYSEIAAAAVFVANRCLNREPAFPRSLQRHCGFTAEKLMPAATALTILQARAPNSSLPAVFKKYSQAKFHEVAKLPGLSADML